MDPSPYLSLPHKVLEFVKGTGAAARVYKCARMQEYWERVGMHVGQVRVLVCVLARICVAAV